MAHIGEYILSIIVAAMICAVSVSLIPSEFGKSWIRLLFGLFLTITIIRPLSDFDLSEFSIADSAVWSSAESIAVQGERVAQDSMASIIRQRCEAYILDKATEQGISVKAEVILTRDPIPVPVSVTIYGNASTYQRLRLESVIQEDLGITKENLQWKE